ncbi:MAG TPA: ribonuclease P protein component [Steroidobacteraceae bacterium]|nr:ribonuclease P protein component [Steroidobacteraceae bacterium]
MTPGLDASRRLTLPGERRLRRKPDFEAVHARGRRMGNGLFAVTARINDQGAARLGLAVASKTAGGSVKRNRIRRVIRESFRLHQHELPAVDIVVSARARAKDAPNSELRAGIEELWSKVRAQCGSSPGS